MWIKGITGRKFWKRTGIVFASMTGLFFLLWLIFPLPDNIPYSTLIYDKNGGLLHASLAADGQWRLKPEAGDISSLTRKTIIEKEDKWFYYHPGINLVAIIRAAANNLFTGRRTSGASTLTMQVARLLEPKRRTLPNKVAEAFRALQLEIKYSKEEILEMYLSLAPYGGNISGIKSAAWFYFGKSPDHLSLAETIALSIIPNRPESWRIGRHNAAIVEARNRWLLRFKEAELFTDKEIETALKEPLDAERRPRPRLAPHLSRRLNATENALNIHSSIDPAAQAYTEKLVADYIRGLKLLNINNAAVLVVENKTMQVRAYVASANFYDTTDGGQVDGIKAIRQPGSTLKPLLYATAIDEGLVTPKSKLEDLSISYAGYAPENYDRNFNGSVTVEDALGKSLNVPAVRLLNQLGKTPFIALLAQCGFKQIKKDAGKLGLSVILGGCGSSLEELTGMYAMLANNGVYRAPHYLAADSTGGGQTILGPAAVFMTGNILSKLQRPDFPLNWRATENVPRLAWKTGTSYGRRDAWSIGYNPRYTVGVWVGNFSGQGIPELTGAEMATPLLFRVFNQLDYGGNSGWFSQPEEAAVRLVCTETGLPPAPFCTSLANDYFIPGISPATPCNHLTDIAVNPEETMSYCVYCRPPAGYKIKKYKTMSSGLRAYYHQNQVNVEPIPPHNPECTYIFKDGAPIIISPSTGTEYFLTHEDPEPLLLSCRAAPDVASVYWYINNKFYKKAMPGEKLFFMPEQGLNVINCTDDKGRGSRVQIRVRKDF